MAIKGNAQWNEVNGMQASSVRLHGVGEQANGKFGCVCKVAIRNGNQFVVAYQAKNKQVFRVKGESNSPVAAIEAAVEQIAEQITEYSRQAYCSQKGSCHTKPEAVAFTGATWA